MGNEQTYLRLYAKPELADNNSLITQGLQHTLYLHKGSSKRQVKASSYSRSSNVSPTKAVNSRDGAAGGNIISSKDLLT